MTKHFKFELVSPEALLISEDAEQVVVPGAEGDFAVLVGHAPVISTLRPGRLDIRLADGKARRIFVRAGFCEVDPASLTVLAQQAIDLDAIDKGELAQAIKNAEDDLADAKTDEAKAHAGAALEQLKQLQGAA
jgi:F-type H+-transporting ATPase subunit epsilon